MQKSIETHGISPIVIESYICQPSKILHVFADHHLYAGTKGRVCATYISNMLEKHPNTRCLLYTSSYNGFGPVACSLAAKENNLKCILVLCLKGFGHNSVSSIETANECISVRRSRENGADVYFASNWHEMNDIGGKLSTNDVLWMHLGFKDDLYVNMLTDNIKKSVSVTLFPSPIKRIFVVGGCGVIARVLSNVFPWTIIVLVPIIFKGSSFYKLKAYASLSKNIYILDRHSNVIKCPYPCVNNYDSRSWDAAVEFGQSGDYIWNVAGGTMS